MNWKRSLRDYGGSHKRWLEEAWREDHHFGGLSKGELHKRWFGSDIIDWLSSIISGVEGGLELSHSYSDDFVLKIIDQRLRCPNFAGKLDIHAETHVDVDANYGFTLIATLGGDNGLIDLSKSYLYFRTKGGVEAKFVVDAAFTAMFDTGDVLMFSADRFGAAFAVPGIVTVGPNFKLFGRLEGEATLGVNFESRVKLLEWDVRQTYPAENDDYEPGASQEPEKSGTQSLLEPTFDYGVSLSGHMTAHVMPTITFGIDFNQDFIPVDSCAVNLVADGHVTFHAELEGGQTNRFCYGLDAGADLYATIDAPSAFNWALPQSPFPIVPVDDVQIFPTTGSPACYTLSKRDLMTLTNNSSSDKRISRRSDQEHDIFSKRDNVYGPLVPEPSLSCPGDFDLEEIPPCPLCGSDDDVEGGLNSRAEGEFCYYDPDTSRDTCPADAETSNTGRDLLHPISENETSFVGGWSLLEKRANKDKFITWNGIDLEVNDYPSCGTARNRGGIIKWFGFRKASDPKTCYLSIEKLTALQTDTSQYATEHIYEVQLLQSFFLWITNANERDPPSQTGYTRPSENWFDTYFIGTSPAHNPEDNEAYHDSSWHIPSAAFMMIRGLGSNINPGGLVLANKERNNKKGIFFRGEKPDINQALNDLHTRLDHRWVFSVFSYMRHTTIWEKFIHSSQHMEQILHEFDSVVPWGSEDGELGRPDRGDGQPDAGFRDLYCYWIDRTLLDIEIRAEIWWNTAELNYRRDFSETVAGKKWLANVLNVNGAMPRSGMRFPRMGNSHATPGKNQIWAATTMPCGRQVMDMVLRAHFRVRTDRILCLEIPGASAASSVSFRVSFRTIPFLISISDALWAL